MTTNALVKPELRMINGTSSALSYAVFARKGKVVLSFKPNAIADGVAWGAENTTYIGARLRSAPAPYDMLQDDEENKVETLHKPDLAETWPGVVFEKNNSERASTQIGVFLRGNVSKNPQMLLDQLEGKKFAGKMADYLEGLAGAENLVITKRQLTDWLQAHYDPIFNQIATNVKVQEQVKAKVEETIGVFGMQAALMKEIQAAQNPLSVEDADTDVSYDTTDEVEEENNEE